MGWGEAMERTFQARGPELLGRGPAHRRASDFICEALARRDPVVVTPHVRRCVLCDASVPNRDGEDLTHASLCPWEMARTVTRG